MRIDAPAPLKNAEDHGLAARAAAPLAADATTTEVRFIDLDGPPHRRMRFTLLRHADAKRVKEPIDRAATDVRELRDFGRLEVERKEADDLPKFGLGNM